jgi:alkylation response protein AidB-like acyl-CoA dehydrogenase
MDVRLSPEQQALRDSVVQVVRRLGPDAVGRLDDPERVAKLDAAVDGAGWRELRTAADDGGAPWASGVEVAIVAEELSAGLADTPFLGPTMAAELRRLAGAPPTTERETVVLDGSLLSIAITAGGQPLDRAVAVDAAGATSALAITVDGAGTRLARVALPSEPVVVDLTRPSVPVSGPAEPLEGVAPLGDDVLARWFALGLAVTSAELVGTMFGAVRLARDYAIDRHQYGVAVGSFQAVQHLLADALVAAEGSSSVARHAAWAVDALPVDQATEAGAVAKAYASRAARTVCETAIQVHGGIGNTWECLAHVHLRRALLSTDVCGGTGPNLQRILAHHGVGGGSGLR